VEATIPKFRRTVHKKPQGVNGNQSVGKLTRLESVKLGKKGGFKYMILVTNTSRVLPLTGGLPRVDFSLTAIRE
jgi:hypothetical protein